jgi:transcriptional regulator with XRE-family HTH domain
MTGAEVKAMMAQLSLTQQQLAAKLGVARNTVNRWANNLEPIPRIAELAMSALSLKEKVPPHTTKPTVAAVPKKAFKNHRRPMEKLSK